MYTLANIINVYNSITLLVKIPRDSGKVLGHILAKIMSVTRARSGVMNNS